MESLRDKTVIITGSSAGIGEGIAVHFAKIGCRLSLSGRSQEKLQAVANRCVKECGLPEGKVIFQVGDIKEKETRQAIIDKTLSTFGQIDVLINNAGVLNFGTVESTTEEMYDNIMGTNLKSHFFMSQLAIPHLKKVKGNIINISAGFGNRPAASVTAYCMSKSALDMFTQCLAMELGSSGVRVNSICPAATESSILLRGNTPYQNQEDYKKFLEKLSPTYPLGRVGQPSDLAKAAEYLASEQSSFVTGQILFVDGGWHCTIPPVPH